MKQNIFPKACSTGRVGNEKPNGKHGKSQSVTARARLRTEAAGAAHSALSEEQGNKSHVQRNPTPPKRDYLCHCNYILYIHSFFIFR